MTYLIVILLAVAVATAVVFARAAGRHPWPRLRLRLRDRARRGWMALNRRRAGLGLAAREEPGGVVATYAPGQGGLRAALGERLAMAGGPDGGAGYLPVLAPARTVTMERPLALAVTARSSTDRNSQDVYYVQPNVIAVARGVRPTGIDHRAATLALSAVMSSGLERTTGLPPVPAALRDSVTSANRMVRSISGRDPEHSGMVTTLDIIFFAPDAKRPTIYLAHVGNSSVWLQKTATSVVQLLSKAHVIDNGTLLRAVGLSKDVVPDINHAAVEPGDRLFLTTASPAFSFTAKTLGDIVLAYSGAPVYDCAAALAEYARSSASPEGITVVAAEIGHSAMFQG